jgi:antitoxin VapB
MALNLKNVDVEKLAEQVARMAGESKTQAIRQALIERKQRLELGATPSSRPQRMQRILTQEIWPAVPASALGQTLAKADKETILGYGPDGF